MKIIGMIETGQYKVTIMVDDPPGFFRSQESQWLYITKQAADGSIGRQSVGIGMSNIDALLTVLNRASDQYRGQRKEFREKSDEFEQRATN